MSRKDSKIEACISAFEGRALDAHYLAYFDCFNRQLFYEAHDVLEAIWLKDRHSPKGLFYKGLIQLAGAFVHLQKSRPGPAAALFRLARENLRTAPAVFEQLDVAEVLRVIEDWLARLQTDNSSVSLSLAPKLHLREEP